MCRTFHAVKLCISLGCIFFVMSLCKPAFSAEDASNVQARAGALQTWREQCADPDPDMRLAYLESAIASNDTSIQRICIRLALQSDNADIRNLGLRAALVSVPQITFVTTMPRSFENDLKHAAGDDKKLSNIKNSQGYRLYEGVRGGLIMCSEKVEFERNNFIWNSLASNSEVRSDFTGKAVIIGSRINWTGRVFGIAGTGYNCTINVGVTSDAKLKGVLDCRDAAPIDIIADLL